MEALDVAYAKFVDFVEKDYPNCWDTLNTEADVRLKVIDRIFVEILGWPHDEIHLEDAAGSGGYIDYKYTVNSLARLIVEAKRDTRDLGIKKEYAGRFFKLNGPLFRSETVQEGIRQAIRYCAYKNAELASVTNGRQWVIFRGNRLGDGKDTLEGLACVFGSLEGVREDFKRFWDLLSYDSIRNYRYRPEFHEAEGQPLRASRFREELRPPASRSLLKTDKLSADLDRVMLSFFQTLTSEDDPELLNECFVTSPESEKADESLARISEDLINRIRTLHTKDGRELTEAVQRVREMKRHEFVLIVGTKGAGKSTFIDRFFHSVLPPDLATDCVVIRVDLANSGGDDQIVTKWLDEHVLDTAEAAVFPDGPPTYEQLQGMFWNEYQRWRAGPHKHLYEGDKTAFKQRFGDHVEKRREERPHEYIGRMLERVIRSDGKVPCLVFDNADHFTIAFQERVFQYAQSLYKNHLCLVLIPITDKTSWQLSRQGALQSFYADSLFLPTPPTQLVLLRRIHFIEKQIAEEKAQSGAGYFFGRGIPLSIDNIRGFANCLQEVFVCTGQVAEWIGALSNGDIRRCLKLTRQVAASPHMKVHELLTAWINKTTLEIDPEDVKLAMIRGAYDIYPSGEHEYVQNVFALTTESDTTPLMAVRILQLLDDTRFQQVDGATHFIELERVLEYFAAMHLEPRIVRQWLDGMLKSGLCFSYDPTNTSIDGVQRVEISPCGRQHLAWALRDWAYLESMLEVTPVLERDVHRNLEQLLGTAAPPGKRNAIRFFLEYLLAEDRKYCVIPDHDAYSGQAHIVQTLTEEILHLVKTRVTLTESTRYGRPFGKIIRWNKEKGYGFVKSDYEPEDVFVHINDVEATEKGCLDVGTAVAFEVRRSEKGAQAVEVTVIEAPADATT